MTYNPRSETRAMLRRGLELVESVPYKVSARWVFYGLLQEGFFKDKNDYKNRLMPALSKARHAEFEGWHPTTLADETRSAIVRRQSFSSETAWLRRLSRIACSLDVFYDQESSVQVWYEARAMSEQFKMYVPSFIILRPMGGHASIPYKYDSAKSIEMMHDTVILYFGDLDEAGETISDVIERDVRKWCANDFEFIRCGLTIDQVYDFDVPENPDKPGEYQWEALGDIGAESILTDAINQFIDFDAIEETFLREDEVTEKFREHLKSFKY